MSKRQLIPFFLMELVVALCMLGCTDVLLERDNQLALSFVAPGASSGRAADGAAHWNVTAWLELEDGTRLQSQQTAAKAGEPVTIPFAPVAAGTRLKVKVELLSAQPPLQKYAGESEFMEVLPGEKTVRLELKLVDAESEEGEKEEPVIEGSLEGITARYNGTNLLVGASSTDFTVIENYSDGNSVEISSIDGLYTVEVPENSIGNVPVTIKSVKNDSIQTQVTVPIKYELDVNNLTITGGDTVEQNGDLKLTAEYKVNGNDSYNLYTSPDSSSSYKIIEYVRISWTGVGATLNGNEWEVNADTKTVGSQTATVMLSTRDDEWCITTTSIEKSHEYTVNSSSGISDENSLLEAINQVQDDEVVTITQEITVTNTITINKNIVIEATGSGKLLRSNKGKVTGPMFEVSSFGNLTLQNITLDGQYNGSFYEGENNPFVINDGGTLTISNVKLINNRTSPVGSYVSIGQLYGSAAVYSAGTTTIKDSTISEVSSNNTGRGIVYGFSGSLTISGTNITLPSSYRGNALYLSSSVNYNINTKTTGQLSQSSYKSVTPTSP